jgi:IS30 family transposase
MEREIGETISHEAIYRFIYAQIAYGYARKGCEDLRPYLRRRRRQRIPHGARKYQRVASPKGVSIDQRPLVVARRSRIGDWEGDTVESKDHKPGVNTLVERKTGIVMITKLKSKKSDATTNVVSARLASLPKHRRKTLTLDNGFENSNWRGIEKHAHIKTFFAHPYHSWERGTNENTNGLIRDYFPKKTDFTLIPDADIALVEYALNTRPRKRLGYRTPLEVWSGALQG